MSERLTHDQIKKWRDSQLAEMAKNGVHPGNVLDDALFLVEEAERALAEKEIEVVIAHDVITSLRATLVEKEETCQECGLRECEHLCRQCHNARCESEVDALRATLARVEGENAELRTLIATGASRGAEISPFIRRIFSAASQTAADLRTVTAERDALRAEADGLRAALEGLLVQIDSHVRALALLAALGRPVKNEENNDPTGGV